MLTHFVFTSHLNFFLRGLVKKSQKNLKKNLILCFLALYAISNIF